MSAASALSPKQLPARFSAVFSPLLQQQGFNPANVSVVLGLSGGADSVALLRLLLASGFADRIRCVHINHQLQPSAQRWGDFCRVLCEQHGVPIDVRVVELDADTRKAKGEEAAAREARYQALLVAMRPDELLLTAHHADDQLETLLHRLDRGTGLLGLQGINPISTRHYNQQRYRLMRPLLGFSKAELLAYLQHLDQSWCEDPSNQDVMYRRNYYRHQVVPQLPASLQQSLLATSRLAAETLRAFEQDYLAWLANRSSTEFALELQPVDFSQPAMLLMRLQRWLKDYGVSLPQVRLKELFRQLERGTALGHNPSCWAESYKLFVKRRLLRIELSEAQQ